MRSACERCFGRTICRSGSSQCSLRMDKRITVSPAFVALICLLICLDTGGWTLPFLLDCGLHEAGHLLAMRCFGLCPKRICIGAGGAVICTHFPTKHAECVIAMAGPTVNALLFGVFWRIWPQLSLVSALLLCYNLLPVYPLDGGRILRCLLGRLISTAIAWVTVCILLAASVYAAFFHKIGLLPLAFVCTILVRLLKNTCQTTESLVE